MDFNENCVLCGNKLTAEDTVRVGEKGLATISRQSDEKGDDIKTLLYAKTENLTPEPKGLRSGREVLDCRQSCVLCAGILPNEDTVRRNPLRYNIVTVDEKTALKNLRDIAQRRADDWGNDFRMRVDIALSGVVPTRVRYHKACYIRLQRKGSGHSPLGPSQPSAAGRKPEAEKDAAFNKLCDYLKTSEECQFYLSDLSDKMATFSPNKLKFSEKFLLKKLQTHFRPDQMKVYTRVKARTIVCFTDQSYQDVQDKWRDQRNLSTEDERRKAVEIAASIVREQIRQHEYTVDSFPPAHALAASQSEVPELLRTFVEGVVKPKSPGNLRKCISVEHCIISACRQRSFVSALHTIAIAVYIHRRFASRELIDVLHSLGLCASYAEVERYESSISTNCEVDIDETAFVQYVFDNADFNVKSLDGLGTFHCMGGIRVVTPSSVQQATWIAPRKSERAAEKLKELAYINIETYREGNIRGLQRIKVADIEGVDKLRSFFSVYSLDALWLLVPSLRVDSRPGWSGFMSLALQKTHFETSDIQVLPFVNLSPSDPSTVFSCLQFSANECKKRRQTHCIVTFDQPLYVKAREIIAASTFEWGVAMIAVLGTFHTIMSFLGTIGYIMAGSGLGDLWETVYAKNSIVQMMNGHSYSRAFRAHLLAQLALFTLLFEEKIEMSLEEILKLKQAYREALNGHFTESKFPEVEHFQKTVDTTLRNISAIGRTSKLWLQYVVQIDILKDCVRAGRAGLWKLHIDSHIAMLPYFHSTGHLNYAKAAHMYIQDMVNLETVMNPLDFQRYTENGFFTIRRTKKLWAGVWSDMTIEQFLMRSMKSKDGLTHGRGMTAAAIAKWIQSMPASIDMISSLQEFCGISTGSSEQHVELRDSRQKRDLKDFAKMLAWLKAHSPFSKPPEMLVSLTSGVVADSIVNCDSAVEVGLSSLQKMIGNNFGELHLRGKEKVVTFAGMKKVIKIRDENVPVSTNQLFHRIVCVVREEDELRNCFQYELAPHPPALFDDNGFMRKGTKSNLISILQEISDQNLQISKDSTYVIDGGHLLHKVVWAYPSSFSDICRGYVNFVQRHYGKSAIVVFDGPEHSTKDEEHLRRLGLAESPAVVVQKGNLLSTPKAKFLSNPENKMNFITFLRGHLEESKIRTVQAKSDADRLIITTAIKTKKTGRNVVVIGEDTDLLVLLIALPQKDKEIHLLIPGKSKKKETIFSSIDLQSKLGNTAKYMLFLHAFSGCDTTSALFRKGKFMYVPTEENVADILTKSLSGALT